MFILGLKNHGKEEQRARDLFYALWIPDLFMEGVQNDGKWSLFCPNEAPGLADCWGTEFEKLYTKYESQAKKVAQARNLWFEVLKSQMETGTPYMICKDSCNRKSNQQHLGTIKSSNLCSEIIEYTSPDETAVCNLASITLPRFVKEKIFDVWSCGLTFYVMLVGSYPFDDPEDSRNFRDTIRRLKELENIVSS